MERPLDLKDPDNSRGVDLIPGEMLFVCLGVVSLFGRRRSGHAVDDLGGSY